MAVTNYYTVGGEIIGEKSAGSSRVDYLTDALGSVTATISQSAQIVNTYRYKPYGGLLAKTGAAPDPAFTWVGSQGYRKMASKFSDFYVRARHYGSTNGRWTSVDPIHYTDGWNVYSYVNAEITDVVDPSGLAGCTDGEVKRCKSRVASGCIYVDCDLLCSGQVRIIDCISIRRCDSLDGDFVADTGRIDDEAGGIALSGKCQNGIYSRGEFRKRDEADGCPKCGTTSGKGYHYTYGVKRRVKGPKPDYRCVITVRCCFCSTNGTDLKAKCTCNGPHRRDENTGKYIPCDF